MSIGCDHFIYGVDRAQAALEAIFGAVPWTGILFKNGPRVKRSPPDGRFG
jgi:hypothetical protein